MGACLRPTEKTLESITYDTAFLASSTEEESMTGRKIAASELSLKEEVHISRTPEELFEMVSDITRMGEWSPACKACWYDEGQTLAVGSWFTGRNISDGQQADTRVQIARVDRPNEFAFQPGGSLVRWSYRFEASGDGTNVTESWDVLPDGVAMFEQVYGAEASVMIAEKAEFARSGMRETLAALKRVAES
jgi:hypothetical protein